MESISLWYYLLVQEISLTHMIVLAILLLSYGYVLGKRKAMRRHGYYSISDYELREQVKILSSSALGMAKRIDRLALEVRGCSARLEGSEGQTQEPALYSQAIRMAERGIGIKELMENFGLPRTEAELLFKLHRQLQQDRLQSDQLQQTH